MDSRIVLLENNTMNHDPGPTRNIGLDYATGVYIYFMDADDWIEDRLLQCAVERMQETDADIVQFGVIHEWSDGRHSEQLYWRGNALLTKDDIKNDIIKFWQNKSDSLWMHLFRREPIINIRFIDAINGEDICYVMDAMCFAEKIAYVPEAFYHYRYVEGSTSHRWIEETIKCREIIWNHQKLFLESLPGDITQLAFAEIAFDNFIWAIYQLCAKDCPLSFSEKREELSYLAGEIDLDNYRGIYPLKLRVGLHRIKYTLVKYHLESILLLVGPVFLRIVRGE